MKEDFKGFILAVFHVTFLALKIKLGITTFYDYLA